MQAASALLLGEHNMILRRNSKPSGLMDLWWGCSGQKRSTCDRRCLFQDHFKAVTLAHQYSRVSRIAWLLQLKTLLSFLTVFLSLLSSGAWCKTTNSCTTGLYIEKQGLIGVWWNTGGLCISVRSMTLRWILSEPYYRKERKFWQIDLHI